MKKIMKERAGELLICLAIFLITLCCFKFVIDDYSYFASNLAAKQFSDFSYFDFHFQGYIGIREIYKLFYFIMPAINWHFVFSVVTEFIGLYLVLRSLKTVALSKINSVFLIRAIQVMFALFYLEDILFISHTRVSLIFCGVAVFNLAFMKGIKPRDIILYSLLFIYGLLLRPEGAMGTLLLATGGLLIHSFNLKSLVKRLWLPALAVVTFVAIFTIDLIHTDLYVRKIEPEVEYKVMADRMVGLDKMKTARDSIKYKAAKIGMWFDTREMSPTYLRSILLPGADISLQHIKEVFLHVSSFYRSYIFIDVLIIVFLILGLALFPDRWGLIIKMVVYVVFTFIVIYALDYNGLLVCNRHFFNLQFISLLVLCFYFFNAGPFTEFKSKRKTVFLAVLFLVCGLAITLVKYKRENEEVNNYVSNMVKTMNKFEAKYTNRVVVVTNDGRFLFDQHFSIWNNNYTKNTYLIYDWFTFAVTPRYVDYLNRTCNCDASDPVAFFSWLASKNALYISAPHRFDLTEKFMRTVKGCNIVLDSPVKVNDLAGVNDNETINAEIRTVRLLPDSIHLN